MSLPLRVTFLPGGQVADWSDACHSLLDLAEAQGLAPPFSCRAGVCNTCLSTLVAGRVAYPEPPLDLPGPGGVLLCCSQPISDLTVRLSAPTAA